mmetsp:Transcript_37083/g.102057  ORF Transcript_37083/g.102057 Transcript_37083/m.102057 type:complete len:683 (+) Transcript_37083:96-2144(+)
MHKRLENGVTSGRRDCFDVGYAWSIDGSADEFVAKRRLALQDLSWLAEAAVPVDELLKEQVALQKLFINNCRSMSEQYETMRKEASRFQKENAALREENENFCASLSDSSTSCGDQVKTASSGSGLRELASHGEKPRPRKRLGSRTRRDKMRAMTLPNKLDDETDDNYFCYGEPKATKAMSTPRAGSQVRHPSINNQNGFFHGRPRSQCDIRPPSSSRVLDDLSERSSFDDTGVSETRDTMCEDPNRTPMSTHAPATAAADEEMERMRKRFAGNPLFPDYTSRKQKVRDDLACQDAVHRYHKTGLFQAIATHAMFESATLIVIVLNSVWLSIDSDLNKAALLYEAHPAFIFAENLFCTLFAAELLIRFMVFRSKVYCLKDGWFVFDAILVFITIAETWVLPGIFYLSGSEGAGHLPENSSAFRLLRLLRLSRMARIVRLLRAVPELMVMMKAIGIALRSVGVTFVLLFIIIYFFSIALSTLLEDTPVGEAKFGSVPEAMNTLFVDGILPDHSSLMQDTGDVHWVFFVVVTFYLLLASVTLLNMLVGILCEVVSVVASEERERMLLHFVHTELLGLLEAVDVRGDCNGLISKKEFEELVTLPRAMQIFDVVGVDLNGLEGLKNLLFDAGAEVPFVDFMDLVLKLRSSNTATVKDFVDLRKFLHYEFKKLGKTVGNALDSNSIC